jgi:hypothetical protein
MQRRPATNKLLTPVKPVVERPAGFLFPHKGISWPRGGFNLSGGEIWRVKDRLSNAISVVIENLTVNASIMGKL